MTSDNTIFSNTTGLSSNSAQLQQTINSLQNQKQQINALITSKESELTTVQGQRAGCQRTGLFRTWDNGCLDTNTAAQNALTTEIANLRQRLVELDAQIAKAQADYQKAVATEAAAAQAAAQAATQQAAAQTQVLNAQALANPETAKVMYAAQTAQKQAILDAASEKQQTMIYAAAGVIVLIIMAVAAMFILKN